MTPPNEINSDKEGLFIYTRCGKVYRYVIVTGKLIC
jgi:hypothetical protein